MKNHSNYYSPINYKNSGVDNSNSYRFPNINYQYHNGYQPMRFNNSHFQSRRTYPQGFQHQRFQHDHHSFNGGNRSHYIPNLENSCNNFSY